MRRVVSSQRHTRRYVGGTPFTYDGLNRLVAVPGGGTTTSVTYDPLGRIHQVTSGGVTSDWLWDGDRLVAEYNSSGGLLARYAHGPNPDEPLTEWRGTVRGWFHADTQGSVIAATALWPNESRLGPGR